MKRILSLCMSLISVASSFAQEYPLTADSREQPQVPRGEIRGPFEFRSTVFPGTVREYWVYVPHQYTQDRPACTLVVQDGLNCAESWKLPTVLDNLIHKKEIPVMIGIFVQWGRVETGEGKLVRYNRSFEYDALGDRYARFLIDELLPEVSKSYHLSTDPNDRMIAGQSSGAICAFNAAWERPDAFRRVYSGIGTYVGLRGGDELATLVRKQEPKPLRVYLEDGSNDLDIYAGGWWTANQAMLAALQWAGYEVEHNWGTGGHNSQHTASILPDALRWLWKEYPKPVESHGPRENRVNILLPKEKWTDLGIAGREITCLAPGSSGELFFYDSRIGTIMKRSQSGDLTPYASYKSVLSKMSFGSDGSLYAIDPPAQGGTLPFKRETRKLAHRG